MSQSKGSTFQKRFTFEFSYNMRECEITKKVQTKGCLSDLTFFLIVDRNLSEHKNQVNALDFYAIAFFQPLKNGMKAKSGRDDSNIFKLLHFLHSRTIWMISSSSSVTFYILSSRGRQKTLQCNMKAF